MNSQNESISDFETISENIVNSGYYPPAYGNNAKFFNYAIPSISKDEIKLAFKCLLNDLSTINNLTIDDLSIVDKSGIIFGSSGIFKFDVSKKGWSTLGSCKEFNGQISINKMNDLAKNLIGEFNFPKENERYDNNNYKNISIELMLTKLAKYSPPTKSTTGGKKQTKERIMLGGKSRVIYIGKRGGKYVKQNGKFVSIKKI
jgi:hypothetical protein